MRSLPSPPVGGRRTRVRAALYAPAPLCPAPHRAPAAPVPSAVHAAPATTAAGTAAGPPGHRRRRVAAATRTPANAAGTPARRLGQPPHGLRVQRQWLQRLPAQLEQPGRSTPGPAAGSSCSACSPVPSNDNGTTSNVHHGMIGRLTSGPNRAVPPNRATHSGNRPRLATPWRRKPRRPHRRPPARFAAGTTAATAPRQRSQKPADNTDSGAGSSITIAARANPAPHTPGDVRHGPVPPARSSAPRAPLAARRRRPRHRRLRPALHPMPPPAAVASNVPAPGTATTTSGTAVPRSPPPRRRETGNGDQMGQAQRAQVFPVGIGQPAGIAQRQGLHEPRGRMCHLRSDGVTAALAPGWQALRRRALTRSPRSRTVPLPEMPRSRHGVRRRSRRD